MNATDAKTLKYGRTTYTVTGSKRGKNVNGVGMTYLDLKGRRGADVTLVMVDGDWRATLIHFGRMSPAQHVRVDDLVFA